MNTQLRIGVLGCANIAKRSVVPAIKSLDGLKLVAVASRTEEKANEFASLFDCDAVVGYDQLIARDDIDAIYMPLPTGLHEEWVMKTLEAKKHILVEKSFAKDHASAVRMIAKAKEQNCLVMENFMFLYHSQHQKVKELIDQGEIGEIRSFRSSFGFPPLKSDNFRYNESLGGGSLLDAAAYTVKASQLYLKNDLKVEAAQLNYRNSEVDIYGGAFLKDSDGNFSEVSFGFDNYYQCNYEIWGSKGKIILHKSFTPKPNEKPAITLEKQDLVKHFNLGADNHFQNILNAFAEAIKTSDFSTQYDSILLQSKLLEEIKTKGNYGK